MSFLSFKHKESFICKHCRPEHLEGVGVQNVLEGVAVDLEQLVAASEAGREGARLLVDARHEDAVALVPAALDGEQEGFVALGAGERERARPRLGRDGDGEDAQLLGHLLLGQRVLEALGELVQAPVRLEVVVVVGDPLEHDAVHLLFDDRMIGWRAVVSRWFIAWKMVGLRFR